MMVKVVNALFPGGGWISIEVNGLGCRFCVTGRIHLHQSEPCPMKYLLQDFWEHKDSLFTFCCFQQKAMFPPNNRVPVPLISAQNELTGDHGCEVLINTASSIKPSVFVTLVVVPEM